MSESIAKKEHNLSKIALVISILTAAFTLNQLLLSKFSERRQYRAYVSTESFELVIPSLERLSPKTSPKSKPFDDFMLLKYKNSGQTPASSVSNWVNLIFVSPIGLPAPADQDFTQRVVPLTRGSSIFYSSLYVGSGSSNSGKIRLNAESLKLVASARKLEGSLYFNGTIDYTDIYGQKWRNSFCKAYQPWEDNASDVFVDYERGNEEVRICDGWVDRFHLKFFSPCQNNQPAHENVRTIIKPD